MSIFTANFKGTPVLFEVSPEDEDLVGRYKWQARYKWVYYNKRDHEWRCLGSKDGKRIWLGRFDLEIEAAQAYDRWARENYGEFAVLNFQENNAQ